MAGWQPGSSRKGLERAQALCRHCGCTSLRCQFTGLLSFCLWSFDLASKGPESTQEGKRHGLKEPHALTGHVRFYNIFKLEILH